MPLIDLTRTVGGAIITVDGKGKRYIGNEIFSVTTSGGNLIFSFNGKGNLVYKISGNSFSVNSSPVTGTNTEIKDAFEAVSVGGSNNSNSVDLSNYDTKAQVNAKDQIVISTIKGGVETRGDNLAKLLGLIDILNSIVTGTAPDGTSVTDTIQEVLSIFSTYPEGLDIATALSDRVTSSNMASTLTSYALKAGNSDIEITDATKGIIWRTSDGTRARVIMIKDGSGNLKLQISSPL